MNPVVLPTHLRLSSQALSQRERYALVDRIRCRWLWNEIEESRQLMGLEMIRGSEGGCVRDTA